MKFRIATLSLLLTVVWSSVFSQHYHWHKQFGNEEIDHAAEVTRDGDNNILIGGKFEGTVDFDPSPAVSNLTSFGAGADGSAFVSKLDPNGHFIWSRSWGNGYSEFIEDIETDANGNVYVLGRYRQTIDLDPGPDELLFTAEGSYDVYLSKLSSDGNLIWAKSFGSSGSDYAYKLDFDQAGSLFMIVNFYDTTELETANGNTILSSSGTLVKLSTNGEIDRVTPLNFRAGDFKISDFGNVFITGNFSGPMDFDPGPNTFELYGDNDFEVYVVKLNANAEFQWAIDFCAGNQNHHNRLQIDKAENIYVVGKFDTWTVFDPQSSSATFVPIGEGDVFLSSYTTNGDFRWVAHWGEEDEDIPHSIQIDSSANIYVTGLFEGTVDFDPGPDSMLVSSYYTSGPSYEDMFLTVLDSSGNLSWVQSYGVVGTEYCRDFHVTEGGEIIAPINFSGQNMDVDLGSDSAIVSSVGWYDIVVLKLGNCVPTFSEQSDQFCTNYVSPSGTYEWNVPGHYTDVLPSVSGCDSIVDVFLTSSITTSELQAVECVQYTSPSGLFTWTESGDYLDTVPNTVGCDSIISIQLTIGNNNRSVGAFACDEFVSPDGNEIWTTSGTYTDTLTNVLGCDSVVTVNLILTELDSTLTVDGVIVSSNDTTASYQWLNCDNNFEEIVGETNRVFAPSINGNYAVEVSSNGCVDTSFCAEIVSINISELDSKKPNKIYPNPTKGSVLIDLTQTEGNVVVNTFTVTGKLVESETKNSGSMVNLDLPNAKGVYFVRLIYEDGNNSKFKVVKE